MSEPTLDSLPPPQAPWWRPYIATLIGCAIVASFTAQRHAGFFLFFVAFAWAIGVLLCMIAFFRDRILFLVRAIRLTLWFVTMLAVAGIHWCYAIDARRVANSFVWVIEQYQSTHGAYPIDLKAAGLDEKTARQTRLGYVVGSDGPSLFYSSTFNGFDTYFYDFRSRNWKFQPD